MNHHLETQKNELINLITHTLEQDGAIEPVENLHFFRFSSPEGPIHSFYNPALCIVVQGSKAFFLNQERYVYDPSHYIIVTTKLPLIGQILEASQEKPFLSLLIDLEPAFVRSVLAEAKELPVIENPNSRAIMISSLDEDLLDAVLRFARLINKPTEASFLAPIITREIIYRLLTGRQGSQLFHIIDSEGNTSLINKAIGLINENFNQQLRVENIASQLGMSVSGFHHHFKAVTAMSPLQYQKQLRLQEARRLLLSGGLNATDVAYRVGYRDASHFSREYKSLFGLPPKQDIERLQEILGIEAE